MWPIIFFLPIITHVFGDCTFKLDDTTPMIANNDFTFPVSLEFESEEMFFIICPDDRSNPLISEDGDRVVCESGTDVLHIRLVEIIDFATLACKPKSNIQAQVLEDKCVNNNSITEVGVTIRDNIVSEVTICFNTTTLSPFYAKHNMSAGSIPDVKNLTYEELINGHIFDDNVNLKSYPAMDVVYLDQKKTLLEAGIIVDDTLVPMPLSLAFYTDLPQYLQEAAYFNYVNTIPLWKSRFSDIAFYLFLSRDTTIESTYVGALEVASYGNCDDLNSKPLYLYNDDTIPVPKWYWISYLYPKASGFFFMYNSPYDMTEELRTCEGKLVCNNLDHGIGNVLFCDLDDVIHPDLVTFRDEVLCAQNACDLDEK